MSFGIYCVSAHGLARCESHAALDTYLTVVLSCWRSAELLLFGLLQLSCQGLLLLCSCMQLAFQLLQPRVGSRHRALSLLLNLIQSQAKHLHNPI